MTNPVGIEDLNIRIAEVTRNHNGLNAIRAFFDLDGELSSISIRNKLVGNQYVDLNGLICHDLLRLSDTQSRKYLVPTTLDLLAGYG